MDNVSEALPGYAPEIGRWLWALADARRRTRLALEDLSQPIVDWRNPHGGNSIGALLYHLAAIEVDWLYAEVLEKPWPPELEQLFPFDIRDAQGCLIEVRDVRLEEHWHRLDVVRVALMDAFRGMSIDEFRRVRHFEQYDVTPEWVLHHLMQHEAEHRGQIGELRLQAAWESGLHGRTV